MALTDISIRNAKPAEKPRKLSDGGGLYLEVRPNGGRWWRLKYRIADKEKLLSLGVYPDVSLSLARERREEARKLLAQGIDPSAQRKAAKEAGKELAANSFERIAREWYEKNRPSWVASHGDKIIRRLELYVFPHIGKNPVAGITAPMVLEALRRIEEAGKLETAHRTKSNISQVMRYAIATGRAERDPCPDLRGALRSPQCKHMAAILDPIEIGGLLRAIDGYNGTFAVKCALKLSPLLFCRPGELRQAEWGQIDLEAGEWRYTASKTKTAHLVPLASQAIAILKELQPITGHGKYVFPCARGGDRPMSSAAINAALQRMGYDTKTEITGHGFRAMARTLLAEELDQPPEVIEAQLAHRVPDGLGQAYNRTRFIKQRRLMMQKWADHLDRLKTGAQIIAIPQAA